MAKKDKPIVLPATRTKRVNTQLVEDARTRMRASRLRQEDRSVAKMLGDIFNPYGDHGAGTIGNEQLDKDIFLGAVNRSKGRKPRGSK